VKRATKDQRAVLEQHYGRKNKDDEVKVKALYNELQLDQVYHAYEEEKVGDIRKHIAEVDESDGLKKEVFDEFLRKIYKRSK
jgi:farnesyl diphosphate synthase